MFETFEMAPADAILGITENFKKDTNPAKINLSVGVYKNSTGVTPILETVKIAEGRILESETSKGYLPINGSADYALAVQKLMFGEDSHIIKNSLGQCAQTPGGTGALRVAGDFIKRQLPGKAIWMSDPTWANHSNIFAAAGLEIKKYPYFDSENSCLDFEKLIAALKEIPAGDVVLIHGCCHNPTGQDPDAAQWKEIGDVIEKNNLIPLLDFAYQGFADGVEEDAKGLREIARPGVDLLVASSFSKNFGLYNERVGALTVIAGTSDAAVKAMSHIKACIRCNYSNPPAHGGQIVTTILNDPELRAKWELEVKDMRDRINTMRELFVKTLKDKGLTQDFSFITRQYGMFSFSGLTKEQVGVLKDKFSIYIVGSGRINVAGMTESNMEALCDGIAEVMS